MKTCHYLWAGAVLLFALALLALNEIAPFVSDDYVYSFLFDARYYWDASFSRPLSGLRDIWDSQVAHYLCCNGRVVAHTLAQLFLLGGGGLLWSAANTLCLLLSAWLMLRLCGARCTWPSYLLVLCLYWLLLPRPGETYFWLTGSCNYQWALLLVLSFLYLWREVARCRACAWLLYPIALLAGNSQEALSAGIAAALALYALARFRSLALHQWCGLALFMLGVATNVFSPGVQERLAYAGHEGGAVNGLARLLAGTGGFFSALVGNPVHWVLPLATLALMVYRLCRRRYGWPLFFGMAAWLSLLAAVYSRNMGARATFGVFACSFVCLLPLALAAFGRLRKGWRTAAWVAVLACTAWGMCQAAYSLRQLGLHELRIAQEAARGTERIGRQEDPAFSSCFWNDKYTNSTYLTEQKEMFQNRAFAAYYRTPAFALAAPGYWSRVPADIEEACASLRPNEFMRIHPDWVLLRVDGQLTGLQANVCFVPSEELDFLRYHLRRSRGWVIGEAGFAQLLHRGDSSYALIPCTDPPASVPQEVRFFLFRGHGRERLKFPLGVARGTLQPWGGTGS